MGNHRRNNGRVPHRILGIDWRMALEAKEQLVALPKDRMRQMLKAAEVPYDTYPFELGCEECGHIWGAHLGMLCPGRLPERMAEAWALIQAGVQAGELPKDVLGFRWNGTFFLARLPV